jgi:hypothetical protein
MKNSKVQKSNFNKFCGTVRTLSISYVWGLFKKKSCGALIPPPSPPLPPAVQAAKAKKGKNPNSAF